MSDKAGNLGKSAEKPLTPTPMQELPAVETSQGVKPKLTTDPEDSSEPSPALEQDAEKAGRTRSYSGLVSVPHGVPRRWNRPASYEQIVARLEGIAARLHAYGTAEASKIRVVTQLAEQGTKALDANLPEVAWQLCKEAERRELSLLGDDAVDARMQYLLQDTPHRLGAEASKPILGLLNAVTDEKGEKVTSWRDLVNEAMRLRDRQVDALYAAKDRVRLRLDLLIAVMLGCMVALGVLFSSESTLVSQLFEKASAGNSPIAQHPLGTLAAAVLLGAIGACLSAMMSFTFQDRAPSEFETMVITAARPLIGAVSGLIALLVVSTDLVSMGTQGATLGFLSFLFGFSERLVMGTVERFQGRKDKPEGQ